MGGGDTCAFEAAALSVLAVYLCDVSKAFCSGSIEYVVTLFRFFFSFFFAL